MADYREFLDNLDRKAYHEGEFQWQEGEYTVTRTNHYSPPGCHDSCGVLLYTKDGKLEKVEGDPLSPVVNGKLCLRCINMPEAVNHPDRLKYPLKRTGERGENKWERISWDEAYDTIVEKVNKFKKEIGGESIICAHGTGRNINWQVPYFGAAALQTPNVSTFGFTGFACYLPRICGSIAPMGDYPLVDASMTHEDRYANDDWQPPEVLVVWGNEPLASNADGYMGHWLVQCVQMGTKIISIDPRLTWWGARAEYWLQVRPGTDAALACAWLNVIIQEDLYDHDFVEKWCSGFDELADSVKESTPEWAAEICGLDANDIRESARLYAKASPGAIQWGLAFDQQLSAMALNIGVSDLMGICGNIDVPGGMMLVRNAFEINAGYSAGEEFTPESSKARKLNNKYALGMEEAGDFIAHASSDGILKTMETADPYPLRMMWIQSTNALSCASMDAHRVLAALKKLEFIVVADPYMTPTAMAVADMVLPVAMSCERNSARTWWTPLRSMTKVTDFYEAKSDEQIIVDLGRRLNPEAFPWKDDLEWVEWYLHDGTGSFSSKKEYGAGLTEGHTLYTKSFKELSKQGGYEYWDWDSTYKKYEKGMLRPDGSEGFQTPSGKFELAPMLYTIWGLTPTPFHTEPPQSPISTPELMEEYPFILTCGGRSFEFFHSEHRQLQTMRELHPQPLVSMNPKAAEKLGLKNGDWAWIENDHGRFKQKVKFFPGLKEDTLHAEHGWWFPEAKENPADLFKTFESNPNVCTKAFETGEGGVGSAIKSMICKVYKAD